ncbi:Gx transporter family protein [Clostridium perfringens]|uniref:Gx transporter family protein n=1 Tax=Clostridium perfringens TaxID=1502 RepID=UPI0018E4C065|nr:Gx transporter family protein [Clostridium perfringens]MBI5985365.1 Gx transporter family protein [Clostridium perfringens]MDK0600561.1 Gx transporter family protein [Clostridium perfringens]MDK0603441.1 Gx transporter family protein [Clostridium perfringens]
MNNINKIVRLSILTTIALTIFMIELHIPPLVPIPGVKLGLANIITLIVLYLYGIREASTVLIIRILLGSMFFGQVVSLLYSLSGGLMCLLVMILLMKIVGKEVIWFVSVGGAIAHNIGQIIIAMILFQTTSVLYYLPVLILSGVITGVFTGLLSKYMITNKVINRLISNSL